MPGTSRFVDEGLSYISIGLSRCLVCRHKTFGKVKCEAFPDGIPDPVWYGRVGHIAPYPGDGGIRFAPVVVPQGP
jgi:hypothetical protein